MFKKFLSSIGIGAAKVDLILDTDRVSMGEEIHGVLHIQGGDVEQKMDNVSVELKLHSYYHRRVRNQNRRYDIHRVVERVESDPFDVSPGEKIEWPVILQVPYNIPFTSVRTKYHLKTNLGISRGLDATDKDTIQVLPAGTIKNFLDAMHELGLVIYHEYFDGSKQVLSFRPDSEQMDQLDHVVFEYRPEDIDQGMSGIVEIYPDGNWLKRIFSGKVVDYAFSADELSSVENAKYNILTLFQSVLVKK